MADEPRLLLGLVGWPLAGSLSPLIHRELMERAGVRGEYRLYPVPPGELAERLGELWSRGIRGLNVTFPHKREAALLCDVIAPDAAGTGAVNTLAIRGGRVTGHNTDVEGFRGMMEPLDAPEPYIVVGSGGAALAVEAALSGMGADMEFYCRRPGDWGGGTPARPLDDLPASLSGRPVTVVNATTLGWRDDDGFPLGSLPRGSLFADLGYNPGWRFRERLRDEGVTVITGEAMLLLQAAASFRIWTGREPRLSGMLETLEQSPEGSHRRES